MWSHYGNGHRGVAIEFDTALLEQAVLEKWKMPSVEDQSSNSAWCKVNYASELPKITSESVFQVVLNVSEDPEEGTEFAKIIQLIVRSKSIEWKIENEWRLMCKNNDETKLKVQRLILPDDSIVAVYLGCRLDNQLKESLVFETKRSFPKATVYKGNEVKGSFGLAFDKIA